MVYRQEFWPHKYFIFPLPFLWSFLSPRMFLCSLFNRRHYVVFPFHINLFSLFILWMQFFNKSHEPCSKDLAFQKLFFYFCPITYPLSSAPVYIYWQTEKQKEIYDTVCLCIFLCIRIFYTLLIFVKKNHSSGKASIKKKLLVADMSANGGEGQQKVFYFIFI